MTTRPPDILTFSSKLDDGILGEGEGGSVHFALPAKKCVKWSAKSTEGWINFDTRNVFFVRNIWQISNIDKFVGVPVPINILNPGWTYASLGRHYEQLSHIPIPECDLARRSHKKQTYSVTIWLQGGQQRTCDDFKYATRMGIISSVWQYPENVLHSRQKFVGAP